MIYVVSGMCRSGTSMMMHGLIKGGIPAVYDVDKDDIRLAALKEKGYDANHHGLFELYKSSLEERFPHDLDGEAVKISDIQWPTLNGYAGSGMNVVYMLRDMECVMQSLTAFTGRPCSENTKLRHNKQGEFIQLVRNRPDVANVTVMRYEDVISNPVGCFEILKGNGFPIDPEKAAAVVDPQYHHFRKGGE
jgi:hypothetical protein